MRHRALVALIVGLVLMPVASAADLAKARLLYDSRLLEDAKRELVEIAVSEAPAAEKAAALHLLGTIAVDEKRYESALKTWNELVVQFPATEDARQVQDKLPLVKALAEQDGAKLNTPVPPPAALSLPSVIVAGSGTETEFVEQAVTEVMNFLASRGVGVSRAPGGMAAVPELTKLATTGGATSVLVLVLRFGYIENLRAECYSPEGRLQWQVKVAGSFGATKAGVTEGLINRIKEKLQPHVGTACTPTSFGLTNPFARLTSCSTGLATPRRGSAVRWAASTGSASAPCPRSRRGARVGATWPVEPAAKD